MPTLGITEVLLMPLFIGFYAIPIAVATWIIITLNRIHSGQKIIRNRLEEIERAMLRGRDGNE